MTALSVRNNNPGNLRDPATGGFRQFATPNEGLDATREDLLIKLSGTSGVMRAKYGDGYQPTLANIISTWAPPSENDTNAYIASVAAKSGIDPAAVLGPDALDRILPHIIRQEGGAGASEYFNQVADSGQIMNDATPPLPAGFELVQEAPATAAASVAGDIPPLPAGFSLVDAAPSDAPQSVTAATPGAVRTVADQFNQGSLLGFGDEATDAIGAGISYASLKGRDLLSRLQGEQPAYANETLGGLYDDARGQSQSRLAQEQANSPGASALAQLAGAIPGTIMGGAALGAIAPASTVARAGAYATTNPLTAAAATGALSGGVYGAGAGSGGLEDRATKALEYGAIGGVAGPLVSLAGRGLAAGAGLAVEKGAGALSKVAEVIGKRASTGKAGGELAALESSEIVPAVTRSTEYAPNLAKADGSIFSKTEGQRSQVADIQRLENDSRAGLYGNTASGLIKDVDVKQNREYHAFVDKLAGPSGRNQNTDINALVDNVAGSVQKRYGEASAEVKSAYDLANASKDGVKISSKDLNAGLFNVINDARKARGIDLTTSEAGPARNAIKDLARMSGRGKFSNVTSAKLSALENWRSRATNAANDLKGKSAGVFLNDVVRKYDDFMLNTANNAVAEGDAAAINAFRTAVSKRAEMGRVFERNKVVQSIAKGEMGLDDTVKTLVGSGAITGRKNMAKTYDAIVKAAGPGAEAVTNDLRQAFTLKTFQNAISVYEPGNPNLEAISPAKLKTQLENLFVNQSEFADKLYGKETADAARQAIKELRLISSSQASVKNPSGSGELIGRFLQLPGLRALPGANTAAGIISDAITSGNNFKATNELKRSLSDFLSEQIEQSATSPIWARNVAPTAAPAFEASTLQPNQGN